MFKKEVVRAPTCEFICVDQFEGQNCHRLGSWDTPRNQMAAGWVSDQNFVRDSPGRAQKPTGAQDHPPTRATEQNQSNAINLHKMKSAGKRVRPHNILRNKTRSDIFNDRSSNPHWSRIQILRLCTYIHFGEIFMQIV
jgi:hypothetical protein